MREMDQKKLRTVTGHGGGFLSGNWHILSECTDGPKKVQEGDQSHQAENLTHEDS